MSKLLLVVACCLLPIVAGMDLASLIKSARLPHREPIDPEVNYSSLQLITSKGYPGEEHWVETVDGYILAMHRIPHGKNQTKGPRPVFFLQHGLLGSSSNWLTNLANESLGYILADNGYDVWMGNTRGNTYSRNHTHLKADTREFWNFTFDEHSQKDLPAMLDYVLNVTGQEKLFYVGHSQGTIMGFAGFTFNQSLAQRVRVFFALAPVTTVKYIQGLFKVISDFSGPVSVIFEAVAHGEFLPNYFFVKLFAEDICTVDMQTEGLCGNVIFLICGYDKENLNISRLPVYYTHSPAGTSVKNAVHLSQEVKSGRFAMYDYGDKKANVAHYGVSPSPAYNVSALKVPVAVFTGSKDWLADPQDVAGLLPKLEATGKLFFHKKIDNYNHLDFIWGMNAPSLIYNDILDQAKKFLS